MPERRVVLGYWMDEKYELFEKVVRIGDDYALEHDGQPVVMPLCWCELERPATAKFEEWLNQLRKTRAVIEIK